MALFKKKSVEGPEDELIYMENNVVELIRHCLAIPVGGKKRRTTKKTHKRKQLKHKSRKQQRKSRKSRK
jgi:hypothetical protein